MHNFLFISTNELFTSLALKMRGVDPDNIPAARKAGYTLVYYEYPQYDKRTHKIEPKANLTPKGEAFVQEFDIVPLSDKELARALEQAKAEKLQSVNGTCDSLMKELVATYPDMEVSTFYKQEEEARAIVSGVEPGTNMLASIAAARGVDMKVLAERVIAHAEAFAIASGNIMGQRQKMEDVIYAAKNVAELDAIDTTFKADGE